MATLCPSNVPGFKACLLKGGGNYSDDFLKVCGFKINRASTATKTGWTTMSAALVAGVSAKAVDERMRDPTRKQYRDPLPLEFAILDGLGYRQTIVVRSYEVKPDKTMTLESILNHLQETALNHVRMLRLGDGFGETHGMMKNNLVWDITRMQVQVDEYPVWGERLEIHTWIGASEKNGMHRDWEIKSHTSGIVFAIATSTWVMINDKTRRLSMMPDDVRAELSPWFTERLAVKEELHEKVDKLDDSARYVNLQLHPKRSDLDMNSHINNNAKYLSWMLEAIPDEYLENYQLSNIILEYRTKCWSSDFVQSLYDPKDVGSVKAFIQSLCDHEEFGTIKDGVQDNRYANYIDRYLIDVAPMEGAILGNCLMNERTIRYTHLLQVKESTKCQEIARGKTTWKKRNNEHSFYGECYN